MLRWKIGEVASKIVEKKLKGQFLKLHELYRNEEDLKFARPENDGIFACVTTPVIVEPDPQHIL